MKKKILFIINPISGIGKQKKVELLVEKELNKKLFDYSFAYTNKPKHAIMLSNDAEKNNVSIVVAVGGDGTVNEVAQGIIGKKTALAIIPTGSGNGLARHLKIPMNLEAAVHLINNLCFIKIDTALLNEYPFINIAGIGLDAHIGFAFSKYSKRGFGSYIKLFLKEIRKYKSSKYLLTVDEKELKKNALLISFANGSQYGNNAVIAPKADVQDGLIDICILKPFPIYALPKLCFQLFAKTISQSKYLETIKSKEFSIEQDSMTAHVDGEPLEIDKKILIKVNPRSLNIIVPK